MTKEKKKHRLNYYILLDVLLAAAVAMLVVSIYAYNNTDKWRLPIFTPRTSDTANETEKTALSTDFTNPDSVLVLVDDNHSITPNYVPSDLVTPYLNSTSDAIQLRNEAAEAAKQMRDAAAAEGITLYVSSGYVDYKTQEQLFAARENMLGTSEALKYVAKAGYSEHQTGLAIDFATDANNIANTVDFANTAASQWLYAHAHEYGFILRYPEGKEDVTGKPYSPWHYRYVGVDNANAIYAVSPDETFEEYFNIKKS